MANLHLVTGYAGTEHITSNDQGSFNAAIMGNGEFVLERGKQFETQVISNNKVRVFDGDLLMQGRHIRMKENTYVDLFFENGTQGYKRTDLIAVRYEKDPVTDIESASLVVIKGVPTEDAYVSSEKITGDILNDHALQNDTVLYKVNFDGLGIQEPEKVFSTVPTLESIKKDTIEQIKQEAEKAIQDMADASGEPIFGDEAPTPETNGKLKQFFVNTENGELFICTEAGETHNWLKIGGGIGGVPLSNCEALALEEGSDQLTLTWKDPDDVVFNGETLAEWAGTKVVRKEGSNPESVEDGILIADSTVRNQYAVDGLQDTDVAADRQYNYALFPYTDKNVYTMSDANRVSGSLMSYDPILANNPWAKIDKASRLGLASAIWNLGDEKDGYTIIGFNHDDLSDGSEKAGITFIVSNELKMSSGAWNAASSNTTFYNTCSANAKLQQDLTEEKYGLGDISRYIKSVRKQYKSSVSSEAYAEMSCLLFLPSYSEITGGISGKMNEGAQYEGMKISEIGYPGFYYWTRTRWHGTNANYAWSIRKYDLAAIDMTTSNGMYYRYCFCI